jgi:uridine kinase
VPVWSFKSHRREGHIEVAPARLIVVEGIHALHDPPHAHVDVGVYVEAPAPVRWARWEVLESSGARGWGVEAAREYFDRVAEPTFVAHAARYRGRAHFIVTNAHGTGV